jgi:hypothetical protein
MNHIVKRFLVLALPFMFLGSNPGVGYSIQVENKSGVELEDFSIVGSDTEFVFGKVSDGAQTGVGNADLQFGSESPRILDVAFTPRHGGTFTSQVEIPLLGEGESIKISINSYLGMLN